MSSSDEVLSLVKPRGRPRKQVQPVAEVVDLGYPEAKGLREWRHYHPLADRPLQWRWAAQVPALGHQLLLAVHRMSVAGGPIATGKSAEAYQTHAKAFINYLSAPWLHSFGPHIGIDSASIPPAVLAQYKLYLDRREQLQAELGGPGEGSLNGKASYAYKGSVIRLLQNIWYHNPDTLGPEWSESSFIHDEFVDNTKHREPYSAGEARRILDTLGQFLGNKAEAGKLNNRWDDEVEIACYVIVCLRLGIETECIDRFRIRDIVASEDKSRFHIRFEKKRSRWDQKRLRTVKADANDVEELIEGIGPIKTAGGALALMLDRARARSKNVDAPIFRTRPTANDLVAFSNRLHNFGLRADDGGQLKIDRTKFRVTHKAAKNVKAGGRLSLIPQDNTIDVLAEHYLENDRFRPLHDQAIARAQTEALAYALQPLAVTTLDESASPADVREESARLGLPQREVRAALSGEADVWLATCRDFENSPFDPPGTPCSRSFTGCLGCTNALITKRVLPRVLRYLDHLVDARTKLSGAEWEARHAKSYLQITQRVLPTFSAGTIELARRIAAGADGALHLPPEAFT